MKPSRVREIARGLSISLHLHPDDQTNQIETAIRKALAEDWATPPSKEMWGELARDIIFWHDTNTDRKPSSLFEFLERIGRDIPQWLREEPEMQNLDHAISKGTRAVLIFRAMAKVRLDELTGGEG